jgi:IclR family acetate operon transcriptional repressor
MSSRDRRRPKTDPRDRYRVPVLDRTLDLLELLSQRTEGLTLTEMTESLAVPKNTVFRIATTLVLRGYAERDEAAKTYRLTRSLLRLGHHALGGEDLVRLAAPVLARLRDESGETALLGTLSGTRGIVLDQMPSPRPVKVVVEIGHAFPLLTAAPAKAMLAFLPPEKREPLLATLSYERKTRHTLRTAAAYRRELDAAGRLGYALDRGEESESYRCAAAPVFNHRGEAVAALWISGPADRLPVARLPEEGIRVKHHADDLSRRLGSGTTGER